MSIQAGDQSFWVFRSRTFTPKVCCPFVRFGTVDPKSIQFKFSPIICSLCSQFRNGHILVEIHVKHQYSIGWLIWCARHLLFLFVAKFRLASSYWLTVHLTLVGHQFYFKIACKVSASGVSAFFFCVLRYGSRQTICYWCTRNPCTRGISKSERAGKFPLLPPAVLRLFAELSKFVFVIYVIFPRYFLKDCLKNLLKKWHSERQAHIDHWG